MQRRKPRSMKSHDPNPPSIRASISFPPDLYGTLEAIAAEKKVSLAWVVRDAVESYVADQTAAARKH